MLQVATLDGYAYQGWAGLYDLVLGFPWKNFFLLALSVVINAGNLAKPMLL